MIVVMRLFTPRTPGSQNVPITRLFINKQLNLVKIRGLTERVLILKLFPDDFSCILSVQNYRTCAKFNATGLDVGALTLSLDELRRHVIQKRFFVKDSSELLST